MTRITYIRRLTINISTIEYNKKDSTITIKNITLKNNNK